MRVLIATDAWHPQINGVVRTLQSLAKSLEGLGTTVRFLTPDGFASVPLPTYPGLRCALPRPSAIAARIEQAAPDAIHIDTTHMTVDEVVAKVLSVVREKSKQRASGHVVA